MELRARYYDGRSAEQREVALESDALTWLRVRGADFRRDWPLAEVKASARIGNTPRTLRFPDGSLCETDDNDAVDRMLGDQVSAGSRLLHRWESSLGAVLAALALTIAAGWAGVVWGIPALAKQAAFALPASTESHIGRDALAALDRVVLEPSRLPAERQAGLRALFAGMTSDLAGAAGYRLECRRGGRIGPNALALPSGIVVLTDELVALAHDDREIEAVLAHELGHLRARHSLRHLLENSATALVVAATLGDVTSLTSLVAAAPMVLVQAKYSRQFEREADDFALAWLRRRGIPPQAFAAILERMEAARPGPEAPDFLLSHPATRERIERARGTPKS